MSSNRFATISSTSASPSARRVRTTRRSAPFFRTLRGGLFIIPLSRVTAPEPAPTLRTGRRCHLHGRGSMRRETLGGWAMIAGAAMGLVTMAFHPTGGGHAALALAVHALALAAMPFLFYGGWVLTRRLSAGGPLAELALAFYGVSAIATLLAATVSGFLASDLIARAAELQGEARAAADALLHYNFA